MNYQTFQPHSDLESLISCYWTLEVPDQKDPEKQRIIPDGCIEMAFILGDDIKRYTSGGEFILRLQTALKMLLNKKTDTLTKIAYQSDYFDQAHFTKDFKEFTGINPKEFLDNENMTLSSLFYK